ncbi:hypothetical protein WL88_27115 [Burkholderia diffusa]|uniref:Uncharacterized protein n=1 Tax=Burkholderia diffusa TaxID=488732 RepID=A0AAW3P8B9_9BURK|nr:hypothetical protein [Burkholderia diffusa]KVN06374.1 hypothetical protein WJ62_06185 [Burkholderia diffusa]KWF28161.1 hypothetical protein WL85_27190 [Burkholderia diffusa]KWF43129.1 hypothetical protein WL87_24250 [Burkholderia diffusa]KWF45742.1 hypothetical protein WL88_27115 [Burkholderia diffusa]
MTCDQARIAQVRDAAALDVDERGLGGAVVGTRPRERHANAGDARARQAAAGANDAANRRSIRRRALHVS